MYIYTLYINLVAKTEPAFTWANHVKRWILVGLLKQMEKRVSKIIRRFRHGVKLKPNFNESMNLGRRIPKEFRFPPFLITLFLEKFRNFMIIIYCEIYTNTEYTLQSYQNNWIVVCSCNQITHHFMLIDSWCGLNGLCLFMWYNVWIIITDRFYIISCKRGQMFLHWM